MSDFKLSDALEWSPKEECHPSDLTDEQSKTFRISEELDLMVSHNKRTMKSVATLVLVVNRMKKPLSHCGRNLSDDELYSFIMDQVVEETILEGNWNTSLEQKRVLYERANSLKQCILTDMSQKNLILDSEQQCKLQAITLKAGYSHLKVNFNMSRYVPKLDATSVDSSCVLLSVRDKNMHLSCSWEDDRAVLNLEECNEDKLEKISEDTDMDRFLFIKRTTGYSLNTFESVKYRGWFISTSSDDGNHSVDMCQADSSQYQRNNTFKVYSN